MIFHKNKFRLNAIRSAITGSIFVILCLIAYPSFANSSNHNHGTPKATIYQNTHVPLETIQLAESLQKGGYTIFFRHERTMMTGVLRDRCQRDRKIYLLGHQVIERDRSAHCQAKEKRSC